MKKKLNTTFILFLSLNVGVESLGLCSSDSKQTEDHYEYPELSVVPRASDRLQSEAEKESSRTWTSYVPIQISALSTLVSGMQTLDSNYEGPGYVGLGVGASWLAMTLILSATYHPYSSGVAELSPNAKGTTRDQLTRERAAEEVIKNAASLGEKIRWFSIFTNLGASIFMLSKSSTGTNFNSNGQRNSAHVTSTAQGFQVASLALALTPLFFRFHWHDVSEEQSDYKKRIYAPVAQPTFLLDPGTQRYVPGMTVSFSF